MSGRPQSVDSLLRAAAGSAGLGQRTDPQLLADFQGGDPTAFEALVRRHGPMVLQACRQVTRCEADAEDAFQATFGLLHQKAATVRESSVAGWLFRVARRAAGNARRVTLRRELREGSAARPENQPAADPSWREACAILHAELDRLPDTYRLPLVLCYLQGLSRDDAAHQLGWSLNTIRGRLERARVRLRTRLERRGLTLSAGLLAVLGAGPAGALPKGLAARTLAALGAGTIRPAAAVPWKVASALAVAAAVVLGIAIQQSAVSAQPPDRAVTRPAAENKAPDPPATITVTGRVLDADGKPVAEAQVAYVVGQSTVAHATRPTTDADGRFRLTLPAIGRKGWVTVVATARGHAPDWAHLRAGEAEVTLRLAKDDVPIAGRITDLENKPVAGATVQAVRLGKAAGGDLGPWIKENVQWLTRHHYLLDPGPAFAPAGPVGLATPVTTDKDGRFRLTGVGRDRAVVLDVRGPGLERRRIWVATVQPAPTELTGLVGLYGPTFTHLAGPAKPAAGTVIDRETGKPLAGVKVVGRVARLGWARDGDIEAVTDATGNYRLDGLPKSPEYAITVETPGGFTYLSQEKTVGDTGGLTPLRTDFALVRGTLVEGRLLDQETGKPVAGTVQYWPLPGNNHFATTVKDKLGALMRAEHPVGKDGTFKLLVWPGPGVVFGSGDPETFLTAQPPPADVLRGLGQSIGFVSKEIHALRKVEGQAYRIVEPGAKPAALRFDLELVKARRVTGTITDSDGKPVPGAVGGVLQPTGRGPRSPPVRLTIDGKTGAFTADGVDPRGKHVLVFFDPARKLAAATEVRGDVREPVTVRLEAWAEVSGRLVDPDGMPVAGATLEAVCEFDGGGKHSFAGTGPLMKPVTTDEKGRFQLPGAIPGLPKLRWSIVGPTKAGDTVIVVHTFECPPIKAGQTKDVGDVKVGPTDEGRKTKTKSARPVRK